MSDEAPPPPLQLGQVLAAERERQGLSRVDIAQRLHMSAWQVEALENGDYTRLPTGTFLRGFVRNYARTLGVDVGRALETLAESVPSGPAPGIVVPTQNIRFDPLGQRFANPYFRASSVAVVAFLLALAATYWWIFVRPAPPAATAARKPAAQAQPVPQNLVAAPVAAPELVVPREAPKEEIPQPAAVPAAAPPKPEAQSPSPGTAEAAARPAKPVDVVDPIVPVQATRAVAGARTVRLRFKGPSWVEIKDRSGKVLLSKINERGSEAEVSGRPPFTVVVGNAPDVTMLYDDREFPLEPHTRVAVARFTLE